MKNNQISDERVINQKRKITGEAYIFIMIFLLSSILVKQFILHEEFNTYVVEFIAFFGSSAYIVIRNIFIGIDLNGGHKKSSPVTNSIIMGTSVTFTLAFLRYNEFNTISDFILESIIAFVCSAVPSFLFFYIINKITQKRVKYMEKQYDEDNE